jgi:hypothetical protein
MQHNRQSSNVRGVQKTEEPGKSPKMRNGMIVLNQSGVNYAKDDYPEVKN